MADDQTYIKVDSLTRQLVCEAKKLDDLEEMLLSMLNAGDKEANQILMDAIKKSKIVFKDIGSKIHSIGGFDLCRKA